MCCTQSLIHPLRYNSISNKIAIMPNCSKYVHFPFTTKQTEWRATTPAANIYTTAFLNQTSNLSIYLMVFLFGKKLGKMQTTNYIQFIFMYQFSTAIFDFTVCCSCIVFSPFLHLKKFKEL